MTTVFPAIPYPNADINSLAQSVLALKQAVDILTGTGENAAAPRGFLNSQNYTIQSYIATLNSTVEELSTIQSTDQGTIASLQTTVSTNTNNIASVGATVSANSSAITSIDGVLSARYSVTINNNNMITGFALMSDGSGASAFNVAADSFNIYASGTSATSVNGAAVFSISTIGGVAQLTINGNKLGDLSTLNNALGNNSVSNSGASSGPAGSGSGNATINVRAGARVQVTAYYAGGDVTNNVGANLQVVVNGVQDPNPTNVGFYIQSGGYRNWFSCTWTKLYTASSAGTYTASCNTDAPSFIGTATITLQELSK